MAKKIKLYKSKEWLEYKYFDEGLSTTEIGKLCGVKACTVIYWAKKHGITLRSKSEALSGERNPMFDRPVSQETREKLSKAGTGRLHTEEAKEKIRAFFKGKRKSEEHCEKLSKAALERFKDKTNHPKYGKPNKWGHHKPEVVRAMKERVTGEGNPMYGMTGSLNPMYGKYGKDHPAWKPPEERKATLYARIKGLKIYHKWRLSVFKRDSFTCLQCGSEDYIQVDHIRPFALLVKENNIITPEEAIECENLWDTDNGRTLCEKCHKKTKTYGRSIKIFEELYKPPTN